MIVVDDEFLRAFWTTKADNIEVQTAFIDALKDKENVKKIINCDQLLYNFITLLKENDINKLDKLDKPIFYYIKLSPRIELKVLKLIVADNSIKKETIAWLMDKVNFRLNLKDLKQSEFIEVHMDSFFSSLVEVPLKFAAQSVSENNKNPAVTDILSDSKLDICSLRQMAVNKVQQNKSNILNLDVLPAHLKTEVLEPKAKLRLFMDARESAVGIFLKYNARSDNLRRMRVSVGIAAICMSFVFGLISAYATEHLQWALPTFFASLSTFLFIVSCIPYYLSERFLVGNVKNEAEKHDNKFKLIDWCSNEFNLMNNLKKIGDYVTHIDTCILTLSNADRFNNVNLLPSAEIKTVRS